MKLQSHAVCDRSRKQFNARLASYLAAASGATALIATKADGAIVANTTTQAFGINGDVNVDFNQDGQTDFQLDHDRYVLGGANIDYLQIDKNDVNNEVNPLPTDFTVSFPLGTGPANDTAQSAYLIEGAQGAYPAALSAGAEIGPFQTFDFQEGDNFGGGGTSIRANRLIDEDQTQIDQALGGRTPEQTTLPSDGPNWVGLNGQVRYLGVRMDLNGASADDTQFNYGWIGVRIDNEADATGAVIGYAYETTPNTPIMAGDAGPFVANADYDDDGDVDGGDFLVWQRQNGTNVAAGTGADGNGNGAVNGDDLALWKSNFGTGGAVSLTEAAVIAVPEAASLALGGVGGAIALGWCLLIGRKRKAIPTA